MNDWDVELRPHVPPSCRRVLGGEEVGWKPTSGGGARIWWFSRHNKDEMEKPAAREVNSEWGSFLVRSVEKQ